MFLCVSAFTRNRRYEWSDAGNGRDVQSTAVGVIQQFGSGLGYLYGQLTGQGTGYQQMQTGFGIDGYGQGLHPGHGGWNSGGGGGWNQAGGGGGGGGGSGWNHRHEHGGNGHGFSGGHSGGHYYFLIYLIFSGREFHIAKSSDAGRADCCRHSYIRFALY